MERVLIVGQNPALCEALCAILEDVGYGVAVCSDTTPALALLRVSLHPFIVLLADDESHEQSYDEPAQAWTQILAVARSLPLHAYVLLSSQPQQALELWNPHTQAFVPVVPLPFDSKLLLTRVAEAARRLRFVTGSELRHVTSPQYDDTPDEWNLATGNAANTSAMIATVSAQEAQDGRAQRPKALEQARAGLVTARAVVVQAREAQVRAWEALTRAQALEARARAWEALTRARAALYRAQTAQEALARVRSGRNLDAVSRREAM